MDASGKILAGGRGKERRKRLIDTARKQESRVVEHWFDL
jgi:hypothetical protein